MRTMTARYRGTCRTCGGSIIPGDTIAHGGRGRTHHTACVGPDNYSAINPATGERMSNRARVSIVRTSSGWEGTRNVRGRCEDAPCCGCCTY